MISTVLEGETCILVHHRHMAALVGPKTHLHESRNEDLQYYVGQNHPQPYFDRSGSLQDVIELPNPLARHTMRCSAAIVFAGKDGELDS